MRTLAIALCVGAIVASCGPTALTYHDLSYLRKGMKRDSVQNMLPISRNSSHEYTAQGYVLDTYPLLVAQVTQSTGGTWGAGGTYSPGVSSTRDYSNWIYLIYENDQLRYWGMMGDIQKSEDVDIQNLAPDLNLKMN